MRATVIIPTHDHGRMLFYSGRTVLQQTVSELELFIIGDGMTSETREVAASLAAADPRVRIFDHPKGPRLGEIYREDALKEARGRIVCYLSDDDLYLPNHVEMMEALLAAADFAHALSVKVTPDDRLLVGNKMDYSLPGARQTVMTFDRAIIGAPLSCMAHTLEEYRRLPEGWTTTPAGTPTDTFMGRKFVRRLDCRLASGTRPTLVRFPSPARRAWPIEARCAELERWFDRMSDATFLERFSLAALDAVVRGDAGKFLSLELVKYRYRKRIRRIRQRLEEKDVASRSKTQQLWTALKAARERERRLKAKVTELRGRLRDAQASLSVADARPKGTLAGTAGLLAHLERLKAQWRRRGTER